jgi:hypothetical protein
MAKKGTFPMKSWIRMGSGLGLALMLTACGSGSAEDVAGEQSLASAEQAIGLECSSNAACGTNGYCKLNQCKAPGTCTTKPTACPAVVQPVCGCDEKTYSNACVAAAAGVSVRRTGACIGVH